MKIAFIGSNPQNFINPIVEELVQNKHDVSLFAFGNKAMSEDQLDLYNTASINLSERLGMSWINIIRSLSSLFRPLYWKSIKKKSSLKLYIKLLVYVRELHILEQCDIINIQQLTLPDALIHLIQERQKVIISFWGSDLYRSNKTLKEQQTKWIKRANHITLHHQEMETLFHKSFPFYKKKITQCLFPLNPRIFQYIDGAQAKLASEKINIAIGYNASPAFKHLDIINQLGALSKDIKSKIDIKIFTAYGGSEEYILEMEECLRINHFEYEFYRTKTSIELLAQRRKKIDILIQLSETDAFSASIAEILYAKNILIAASWLPYSRYEHNDVYFHRIDTISNLEVLCTKIIDNLDLEKEKCVNNSARVIETLDFKGNLEKWISIFKPL